MGRLKKSVVASRSNGALASNHGKESKATKKVEVLIAEHVIGEDDTERYEVKIEHLKPPGRGYSWWFAEEETWFQAIYQSKRVQLDDSSSDDDTCTEDAAERKAAARRRAAAETAAWDEAASESERVYTSYKNRTVRARITKLKAITKHSQIPFEFKC